MIDVDEVVLLEAGETGALHAVAFQDDDGLGFGSLLGVTSTVSAEGQRTVDAGHAVAEYDAGLLAHAAQNLSAGQRRSHRIAIRTGMGGENELLSSTDLVEDFVQHGRVLAFGT